ncbi:MAG TPA: S8 family serine peptidase [Steroidobacteraceae bacterium]
MNLPGANQLTTASAQIDSERYIVVTVRNPAAPVIPRAGSTARDYDTVTTYSVSPAARATANDIAAAYQLHEVNGWPIRMLSVHCVVFEIPAGVTPDQLLDRLKHDPRVESAQPLQSFSSLTSDYNDPYEHLQHNLDTMNVVQAHNLSRGNGVRIAIIDTGVDAHHPDLVGQIVKQRNFVDNTPADSSTDRHGTAVAGIIAARGNNHLGIVGVAPGAQLYSLKACWPERPNGARALCNTFTLARALAAAIDDGAAIVNLSLSGPDDPLLARMVDYGAQRGVMFVGAVPPANAPRGFPTDIAAVIKVDSSGAQSADGEVLFAPGTDVLTLVPDNKYDFLSGSSLAAASISGGIALLLARQPNLTASDARELLATSSTRSGAPDAYPVSVNLCTALVTMLHQAACSPPPDAARVAAEH